MQTSEMGCKTFLPKFGSMSPLPRETTKYSKCLIKLHNTENAPSPRRPQHCLCRDCAAHQSNGGSFDARDKPPQPKFLHFHAVFGQNWANNRLSAPCGLRQHHNRKRNLLIWTGCSFKANLKLYREYYITLPW